MENDSFGSAKKQTKVTVEGNVNEGFKNDEVSASGMRRCHSDTSLNEHTEGFEENPNDLVNELRVNQTVEPKRTRHFSQPAPPPVHGSRSKQYRTPRPLRSPLVSMDGMVFDPINRRFLKRSATTTDSNPDLSFTARQTPPMQRHGYNDNLSMLSQNQSFNDARLRNPQIARLQRNGMENGYANPQDLLYINKPVRHNSETRSMGGGSMQKSIAPSYRDIASLGSIEHHSLPPSTEEEKFKTFKSMLSTVGSTQYAVIIVTIGLVIFVYDIFIGTRLAEIYCLYLVTVGFFYLCYLLIDVRLYINKAIRHYKERKSYEEAYDNMMRITEVETLDGPLTFTSPPGSNGQMDFSLNLPSPVTPLEHPYCFMQGRHAGSFYLKLGAAGFCLGHLVHSALLLTLQIMFINSDFEDCGSITELVLDVIFPMYSFCQLFFIFKYSNVIILRNKGLGRFATMHWISSSLCFWIWTIIRETMDAIVIGSNKNDDYSAPIDRYTHSPNETREDVLHFLRMVGAPDQESINEYRLPSEIKNNCSASIGFDQIFNDLSPYLYPFTVEYNILIVGIFYIIWSNIGSCPKEESGKEEYHDREEWVSEESLPEAECKVPTPVDENGLTSNLVIHIDCHSANKGLFAGIAIVVFTIVALIMTFVLFGNNTLKYDGIILLRSTDLILHLAMLAAIIPAFNQTRKLDVNPHPISLLDDILLFICIPAFMMELTFTTIAVISYPDAFLLVMIIFQTIQALVQTAFIADALRRCSNSKTLQRRKPGRELVTFLIVCNVATWVFETFSIKNAETNDIRYDMYGKVLWSILGHVSTPLTMFYRFHSSVCLVDIWKGSYLPGSAH